MREVRTMLVFRVDEVEFHHQLASVADTERHRILARIEPLEGLFGLGIIQESTCPALRRTQNIGVGESSTEHDHADFVQRFAPADEVGHHHILHVEARQPQRIGHLALAIGTLLADNGSLGPWGLEPCALGIGA